MSLTNDCTNIKLPYCEQRNERTYKKRQEYWKDGYKLYLHKETWDYDFKQEGTVRDCEQSFLSEMIFGHFLKAQGYNDFSVNRYFMYVNGNDNKNMESTDIIQLEILRLYLGQKICKASTKDFKNDGISCQNIVKKTGTSGTKV